jgi:hypothetical protein
LALVLFGVAALLPDSVVLARVPFARTTFQVKLWPAN